MKKELIFSKFHMFYILLEELFIFMSKLFYIKKCDKVYILSYQNFQFVCTHLYKK